MLPPFYIATSDQRPATSDQRPATSDQRYIGKVLNQVNALWIRVCAVLVLLSLHEQMHSQVFTRILAAEEHIHDHIPWYFRQAPDAISLPPIDVQAVLEQDARDGDIRARYGIKASLGLTQEDGVFYDFGNYSVWKLQVFSDEARSLNFIFSNLNLPAGIQMFIQGMEERMIHGPVMAYHVHDGIYVSDIVIGEYATIEVFIPEGMTEMFSIRIDNAIHGIDQRLTMYDTIESPLLTPRGFGDSQPCNINTVCPEGEGWDDQISAVCLILRNTTIEHCTGTVITNACNDLTPLILTAEHCILGQDLDLFVFRFNYESTTCPVTFEPPSSLWISFSGAQLRANWENTDFALLALNNPFSGTEGISFAGWDRSNSIPSNTTCIHHPNGDVKKISMDNDSPNTIGNFLEVIWDSGTTEPGSSGSGLFNNNRHNIGQLLGGLASCDSPDDSDFFGWLFYSWTGGGTNTSRLSNWLGNGIDPMNTDAILYPSVSGSDVICTTENLYILQNPLPGYSVTWSVEPSVLFGSPTSGEGVEALLWPSSSFSNGEAALTYTLTNAICGEQTFARNIWIGKPLIHEILAPECFFPGSNYSIQVISSGATHFAWTFPNCPNGKPSGDPDPECWFNYTGDGPNSSIFVYAGQQAGYISVWASNECGTTSRGLQIEFCEGEPPCNCPIIRSASEPDDFADGKEPDTDIPKIRTYPNPVRASFMVELYEHAFPDAAIKSLTLSGVNGQPVYRSTFTGSNVQVITENLSPGVYFLSIKSDTEVAVHKIVIH